MNFLRMSVGRMIFQTMIFQTPIPQTMILLRMTDRGLFVWGIHTYVTDPALYFSAGRDPRASRAPAD